MIGLVGGVLRIDGLAPAWDGDAAARLLLPFAAIMVPLTVLIGGVLGLAFDPVVAVLPAGGLKDRPSLPAAGRGPTAAEPSGQADPPRRRYL